MFINIILILIVFFIIYIVFKYEKTLFKNKKPVKKGGKKHNPVKKGGEKKKPVKKLFFRIQSVLLGKNYFSR